MQVKNPGAFVGYSQHPNLISRDKARRKIGSEFTFVCPFLLSFSDTGDTGERNTKTITPANTWHSQLSVNSRSL